VTPAVKSMRFTPEQEAIVSSSGDIKINAVAGSGKTTVLVEYAKRQERRRSASRILYLAFNRSARQEAQRRFAEAGTSNVDVQTAHSIAYRSTVLPGGYQVSGGYRLHDVVRILGIEQAGRDRNSPYAIARYILKFGSLFCNSDKTKVHELDYRLMSADEKALAFIKHHYEKIENGARLFLAKMDRKEIPATHDFYLKKFQLSRPALRYDVILFDEGQDASPVMLDVFLAQKSKKVIVGDVHQQIYGWRHAINALRQVDFPVYGLTTSFRFNDHVAALAMECLSWKQLLGDTSAATISGVGANKKIRTRATIARTNLALLKNAILTVRHDRTVKKIYFEGNIGSYTYAADGASIYDVLNLFLDKKDLVRDPLIRTMRGFEELEDYAEKSGDMELKMLIDIVDEYGTEIPYLLKRLTSMHVADDQREKADMIFSTLHRSKGMEYDSVTLTDDFITRERIRKLLEREKREPVDRERLSEEVNLAYVAVTRSRNFLDFPECMFPLADKQLFAKRNMLDIVRGIPKKRDRSPEKRSSPANAYLPWTKQLDRELTELFLGGASVKTLAERFGRKSGAIRARLRKLGGDADA
jgi:superfamily I DNA/RNA helicase